MKPTYYLLCALAAASFAYADAENLKEVKRHGVTFTEVTVTSGLQGHDPVFSNFYLPASFKTQGNFDNVASGSHTIQGLYMDASSGLRINGTGSNSGISVTYLYLHSSIGVEGALASSGEESKVCFGTNAHTPTFSLSNTTGAWLDIDADYGNNISTASMSGGTVYLNQFGHLNSTLSAGNTLVATAVTDQTALGGSSNFQFTELEGTDYTLVTRTLMTGDFSSWDDETLASVQLGGYTYSADLASATEYTTADLSKYFVTADANGLSISYLVPEPASTALSLLALASLAARRRRR